MKLSLQQVFIPSEVTNEYNRCKKIVFDELQWSDSEEERQVLKKVMERIVTEFMGAEA